MRNQNEKIILNKILFAANPNPEPNLSLKLNVKLCMELGDKSILFIRQFKI